MKAPTKKELYEQINAITKENQRLSNELQKEQREQWEKHISEASKVFYIKTREIFGNMIANVSFKHVDAGGYWFTFELINDKRTQTYCVRHSDI